MNEVFPIVAGIVSGLFVWSLVVPRFRTIALISCGAIFGAGAAWISGELLMSWVFLAFDVALVLLAAGATVALITLWQRHRRQSY